ncbi:MAG: DUF5107 domain-containing protein [Flavobacteriaceae bacterium]|nr:DUF5107 domain-containing protein [Flavobacteriaceae bacterium]
MKKKLVILVISALLIQLNYAQKATITEKKMVMKTYMFSDPNPVPDMDKNYPYFRFDGYTEKSTQQEWNMVILENDYIKVFVNTDIGGKIWGAIEKSTGGEFLYYNDVVKFRDVAHRGLWTSGGLEFNYGIMGHTSTGSTPQDYVIKENKDGSVSCVVGAIDLHTQTKWNVEIRLQKDKAYIETIGSWYNTGNLPQPFYHYSNAAAKTEGNLEFIFPGSYHIGHEDQIGSWPIDKGRDISFYEKNNFEGYKSYHIINAFADYMGGYYHDDDFGFGNIHSYDKMPGRKLWIWGLADEGMIWEDLLTDSDGQYIEFQTGGTFNQPMEISSLTPFKHREFIPYDSDLSTELYFPLKQTGGMVSATKNGVLNVIRKNESTLEVRLSALSPLDTDLVIKSENKLISTTKIKLQPLELSIFEVALEKGKDYTIELGNDLLFYSSKKEDIIVDRPVVANKDFDWNSAIGLFTKGLEIEKQYSYGGGHSRKVAQDYYLKSLAIDSAYAPALNRVAFNYYRMMQYKKALLYTNKSLSIDTYDPEANYLFGIINVKLEKLTNAKSGFSIASQSTFYRTAAYTELARLYLNEKRYNKSLTVTNKALMFNQSNVVALEIQAVIFRLQKNEEPAKKVLTRLYDLDNTSAFVVNERILSGIDKSVSLSALITNELQAESYIRLALKYKNFGLIDDSISALKASPSDVKVHLLLAHLDVANQTNWLKKAIDASPYLVFPFRTETYEAIIELMKSNTSWKLKYYASLVLWKKERVNKAKELIKQCGNEPNFAPFYLSKANLFSDDKAIVKASLAKAKALDSKNWRVSLALVDQYMKDKNFASAAKIAKKNYYKNKELSIMGMRYADALLKSGKYKQSLSFLRNFKIIPFEGATEGRMIHHEVAIKLALNSLKKKNYKTAIDYVEKAKLWPKKLGAGMPYNVDERFENSILAYCNKQLDNEVEAKKFNLKIIDYKLDSDDKDDARLYLQVLALGDKVAEAKELVNNALAKDDTNETIQWVKALQTGDSSVKILAKKLLEKAEKTPLDNSFLLVNDFLNIIKN